MAKMCSCGGWCGEGPCPQIDPSWTARKMTDEELLERALAVLARQNVVLGHFHRRHGRGGGIFEDLCCREFMTPEVIAVLAEGERRKEQKEARNEG